MLGVVLQHRLRPATQRLKAMLETHALGRLTRAAVDVRWWRPQSYYDTPGRGTLARDGGGVLMTQAIHTLDLFLYCAGPVVEVAANATTSVVHRMECEDVVVAIARTWDDALVSLHATTAAYPGFAESIELSGTLGTARLSGGELFLQWHDGREERFGEPVALGSGANPMAFSHAAHKALIEDFVIAVQNGTTPAASGRSALAVHQLIDALMTSSASRGFVSLQPSTQPT
jgi:predicted dehydrogenase